LTCKIGFGPKVYSSPILSKPFCIQTP